MGQFSSELTRKYLLNSHSRGSLDEVAAMDAVSTDQQLREDYSEPWLGEGSQGVDSMEGQQLTQDFFRLYYE
ncbi:hypothetical protein D3C77_408160 [compost metagenome]